MEILHGEPLDMDPRCLAFLEYWRTAGRGKPMPTRGDIDPLDMPRRLLPNLMLVDVTDGGQRFRYRLIGDEVARASGRSLKGVYVGEAIPVPSYAEYILGLYRRVCQDRRPVLSVSNFGHPRQEHIVTQRIMCPLSEDGETVSMVIACQVFDINPARWGDINMVTPGYFHRLFEAVIL